MLVGLTIAACPVCDGKPTPLGVTVSHNLNMINEQVSINYAACLQCGFVFQANPMDWDSLAKYYRMSPRYRSVQADPWDRALCLNQLHFIEEAGPFRQGCKVLDIGADMGKMLDLLADKYGCATSFIEENEAAREYLRGQGRHNEILDLDGAARFDWCILSQVLEHIVHPVNFLEKVREHLEENGNLFIEVPGHAFWDGHDHGFSFEHVNYFSPLTLTLALHKAGFIVTKLAVTSDARYFHGKIRIIRVIATPKPALVRGQLVVAVREHQRKEFGDRFRAVEKLANHYCADGRPGLAFYGAAELADLVFSNTKLGAGNLAAIFDTDKKKHGQDFHGFMVTGADRHSTMNVKAILILSSAESTIRDHLLEGGYSGEIIGWSDLSID